MYLVFNYLTGKMLITVSNEATAKLICNHTRNADYVDVDEEFTDNLNRNPEWSFLYSEAN